MPVAVWIEQISFFPYILRSNWSGIQGSQGATMKVDRYRLKLCRIFPQIGQNIAQNGCSPSLAKTYTSF